MAELIRYATQWHLNNDDLPLHPDFWDYIQKDDKGYFITLAGARVEVTDGMALLNHALKNQNLNRP